MNEIEALLEAFDAAALRKERCALATIVGVEGSAYRKPGARMLVCESGSSTGTISAGCLEHDVIEHAKRVIERDASTLIEYDNGAAGDEAAWGLGLGCNGIVRVLIEPITAASPHLDALRRSLGDEVTLMHENGFIETLTPPVPLLVFGAGPDVRPLVELACRLGWRTEVVDPQARTASTTRFAMADKVTLARPEEIAERVTITPRTVVVVMSHHYLHDEQMLGTLLRSPARYIGVMGPRKRTDGMLQRLGASEADRLRLHAPVGLDIGADGPEEIALSIIAEIKAVLALRSGRMLREHDGINGRQWEEAPRAESLSMAAAT